MKLEKLPISKQNLGAIAGAVTIVVIAFYVTGLYLNYLGIKKTKKELAILENAENK